MNIPSSDPVVDPEGVDGNIHTNGLGILDNFREAIDAWRVYSRAKISKLDNNC